MHTEIMYLMLFARHVDVLTLALFYLMLIGTPLLLSDGQDRQGLLLLLLFLLFL